MRKLTANNVFETLDKCMFKEGEDTSSFVPAMGITVNAGFHPQRLEEHRQEIADMLGQLPESFFSEYGDSFLNACLDHNGDLWTGLHQSMEQLFLLGLAAGYVTETMDRGIASFAGVLAVFRVAEEAEGSDIKVVRAAPLSIEVVSMSKDRRRAQIVVRDGDQTTTQHVRRQSNGSYANKYGTQYTL